MTNKSPQKILTKKDVKGAVVEALGPFARAVQTDFQKVNKRLSGVDSRLDGIDSKLSGVEFELREVKRDVREMKERSSELFEKLDKFITLYEKQEQELLMLGDQVRRLEERIAELEAKQRHS